MAVNDTHEQFNKYSDEWRKARDASEGQRAVHGAGTRYLPKLSGQDTDEYDAYLKRALFMDATSRTIRGLKGMIFRKPAVIEFGGMETFLEDVTMDGSNITDFAGIITDELLEVGRVGVLVDFPRVEQDGMTAAEAASLGSRPFLKTYTAESIINWREGKSLEQVRLKEMVEVQKDEFDFEVQEQIRVLDFSEGAYRQRIFRKQKTEKGVLEWVQLDEVFPVINGRRMDFIPFVFFSPDGLCSDVVKPPLSGLVNVNLSHYRTTADLEHGAHFTGLPTPVITGHTPTEDDDSFRIGSATAWLLPDPAASASYMEFTGQGLSSLKELAESKQVMMAALGAQMLTPENRRNEAVETAAIRHMGENSILSDISQTISRGLNQAIEFASMWLAAVPGTIELNRDFMPQPMTPNMLKELVSSWQVGAISAETLFDNLKAGEIIENEKEFDEEQSEIQTRTVM